MAIVGHVEDLRRHARGRGELLVLHYRVQLAAPFEVLDLDAPEALVAHRLMESAAHRLEVLPSSSTASSTRPQVHHLGSARAAFEQLDLQAGHEQVGGGVCRLGYSGMLKWGDDRQQIGFGGRSKVVNAIAVRSCVSSFHLSRASMAFVPCTARMSPDLLLVPIKPRPSCRWRPRAAPRVPRTGAEAATSAASAAPPCTSRRRTRSSASGRR